MHACKEVNWASENHLGYMYACSDLRICYHVRCNSTQPRATPLAGVGPSTHPPLKHPLSIRHPPPARPGGTFQVFFHPTSTVALISRATVHPYALRIWILFSLDLLSKRGLPVSQSYNCGIYEHYDCPKNIEACLVTGTVSAGSRSPQHQNRRRSGRYRPRYQSRPRS